MDRTPNAPRTPSLATANVIVHSRPLWSLVALTLSLFALTLSLFALTLSLLALTLSALSLVALMLSASTIEAFSFSGGAHLALPPWLVSTMLRGCAQ